MNLFEAKHILQSVGYTVNEDLDNQFKTIMEAVGRRLSRYNMLSEMSKARADKAKKDKVAYADLVARLEQDMASMDSKHSDLKTGKTDNPTMKNVNQFRSDYESLLNVADELDDFGKQTLSNFEADGYLAAVEQNNGWLLKKTDKGNGAGARGNFNTAFDNEDWKGAYDILYNRQRSGGKETVQQNLIAGCERLLGLGTEILGADLEQKVKALLTKATNMELKSRSRAADTYTAFYDENVKVGVLKAILTMVGVKEAPIVDEENMSITFTASPGVAAKATEMFSSRFGMEVVKNERQTSTVGAKETRVVKVDDTEGILADVIDLAFDNIKATYEIIGDNEISITGTAGQIKKAIEGIESLGIEVIE